MNCRVGKTLVAASSQGSPLNEGMMGGEAFHGEFFGCGKRAANLLEHTGFRR